MVLRRLRPLFCLLERARPSLPQRQRTHTMVRFAFYFCDANFPDFVQEFYEPHKEPAKLLQLALRDFERFANEDRSNGANAHWTWLRRIGVACQMATLLDGISFPNSEEPNAIITFSSIQGNITNLVEPMLVFLDEIPPLENSDHWLFVRLRDVLRALGISPVAMSTHTGAQNGIIQGSDSSSADSDPHWCRLVTRKPRFHTTKPAGEIPYHCPLERPLVASYHLNWTLPRLPSTRLSNRSN